MSDDHLFRHRDVRRVPKPWGYELIFAKTDRYVGKILHITNGESLSLQYHEMKEETLYVVAGELMFNGQSMSEGDGAAVAAERVLSVRGLAPTGGEFLLFDLP